MTPTGKLHVAEWHHIVEPFSDTSWSGIVAVGFGLSKHVFVALPLADTVCFRVRSERSSADKVAMSCETSLPRRLDRQLPVVYACPPNYIVGGLGSPLRMLGISFLALVF